MCRRACPDLGECHGGSQAENVQAKKAIAPRPGLGGRDALASLPALRVAQAPASGVWLVRLLRGEEATRGRGQLRVIRVALDAMGGDNAPRTEIEGAALALQELPPTFRLQLVGPTAT